MLLASNLQHSSALRYSDRLLALTSALLAREVEQLNMIHSLGNGHRKHRSTKPLIALAYLR